MTREEHIENLKAIASDMPSDKCADWIESLMAGVKALEQEPCEDVVSRQAVIDTLTKTSGIRGDALKALYDLPSVTPRPKMGYISIDDVMAVFDNFMRGDVDENDTETFLEMLKDKAEWSDKE